MFKRMLKSAKVNFCFKECCIVSGHELYQSHQLLPRAMIPVSFWCFVNDCEVIKFITISCRSQERETEGPVTSCCAGESASHAG